MASSQILRLIGIVVFVVIIVIITFSVLKVKLNVKWRNFRESSNERDFSLYGTCGYDTISNLIAKKATPEIIIKFMDSLNWEEFNVVYLENEEGKMIDVSGNIHEDGLSSGFGINGLDELKNPPPKDVEEMKNILITFLKSEEEWRKKYHYE